MLPLLLALAVATGGPPGLAAETAVPVDGPASIRAEGRRDDPRAAERWAAPSPGDRATG